MSNSNPIPLTGTTILVTRAAGQSSEFCQLLQQQGAVVMEMPALEITPPSSWFALDEAIANLHTFNWLILTSTNAVDYFFSRLQDRGKNLQILEKVKIAVVGKKTAGSLAQYNLSPDFIPPDFVADSLVANFPEELLNQNILFPRVETGGREVLVQELTAKGAKVVEVPAYQSGCPSSIAPEVLQALREKSIDIITFASSKTVQYFYQLIKDKLPLDRLQEITIASIGPQTSKTCQELLGKVDIEATEYTLEGLTEAIVKWVQNKHG
ncbi:uroporphyrinogen-III synthase [Floridanema evergladense]|uniref:Uroporphyrinogen-III synthase n=1 Tax=Floridaenema evergladense BLCC-F167 TaxID=3153639 RepID=A0ABV4WIA8_9CYAN